MAQYNYSKYNNKITYSAEGYHTGYASGSLSDRLDTLETAAFTDKTYYYTSISTDSTTGKVTFSGPISGGITVADAMGSSTSMNFYLKKTYEVDKRYVRESVLVINGVYSVSGNDYTMTPQNSRGGLIGTVTAEDGTFPINGRHTDGYWYIRGDIANSVPTITGIDSNLGDKTTPLSIIYQVNDEDVNNSLTIKEKLNGATLRNLSNAPKGVDIQLEITKELFDSLELNSTNNITIEVDDGNSGLAYRNYTFTKSNSAPIISGIDTDLGVITEIPSQVYQVSDNEGDAVTITEKINDMVIRTFEATSNTDYTITIPELEWFKLNLGQHTLKIEALDARGGKSIRTYTFTRADDKIKIELKTPFVTDMKASKLLISPTWVIPQGATAKVEACNNAYDESPTWEDITGQVLINRHYNFTNAVKTAEKWGINIRFTLEKGTATNQVILDGFGGAFE